MGYRSEVAMLVGVSRNKQADELMAVYALDPLVQKHNLMKNWTRHNTGSGIVFTYHEYDVKWYDDYEDVRGLLRLGELAKTFSEQRGMDASMDDPEHIIPGFPYAYLFYRIGEEMVDIRADTHCSDGYLQDFLWDCAHVRREIVIDL